MFDSYENKRTSNYIEFSGIYFPQHVELHLSVSSMSSI